MKAKMFIFYSVACILIGVVMGFLLTVVAKPAGHWSKYSKPELIGHRESVMGDYQVYRQWRTNLDNGAAESRTFE